MTVKLWTVVEALFWPLGPDCLLGLDRARPFSACAAHLDTAGDKA